MTFFTKIYRTVWVVLIILIVFLDRNNLYWVVGTITLLLLMSGIAVLRILDSRNEWRKIIQEESLDKDIPWLNIWPRSKSPNSIPLSILNLWVTHASKVNLVLVYAEKFYSFESSPPSSGDSHQPYFCFMRVFQYLL